VQSQAGVGRMPWNRIIGGGGLAVAGLLYLTSLTAYLTDLAVHPGALLDWYDLNVYNDAGLITRQLPSILYTWQLTQGVKFTYTPFAALVFALGSLLSWATLRWLMTVSSLAAVPVAAWLTLGAMGRRGAARLAAALAVAALALWTEPVVKGLFLGQIEPVLLLLVVWDLTRGDRRAWKGIGVGIAAGIKLVPLLFIPYLLVAGKTRQALTAAAAFAGTIAVGFAVLPGPSASYWLTGYFIRPGRTGGVDSLVNQSLLGAIARAAGGVPQGQPIWLPVAIAVALAGLAGGAAFARSGRPVHGWVLVGITSVLVSPISWDHHWVWIVPLLALLAGLAMEGAGRARAAWVIVLVATAAVFGAWPWQYSGPLAFVPGRGLLAWAVRPPQIYQVTSLHGWQLLTWNLFVAAGGAAWLALLAGAWLAWRRRPKAPRPAPAPPPGEVDALLARADAVLKGDRPAAGPAALRA